MPGTGEADKMIWACCQGSAHSYAERVEILHVLNVIQWARQKYFYYYIIYTINMFNIYFGTRSFLMNTFKT